MSNQHTPTIEYESPEKAPNGQPYLTVKKARNYYYYGERAGIDSVFFILYDENSDKPFGLINEAKPPLDERLDTFAMATTAFGGSIDSNNAPTEIAKQEVLEEAGYDVDTTAIIFVGSTLVSTQLSQLAHGFIVNVTDLHKSVQTESELLDASDEFARNSTVWLTLDELVDNNDWKSCFIALKLITTGDDI